MSPLKNIARMVHGKKEEAAAHHSSRSAGTGTSSPSPAPSMSSAPHTLLPEQFDKLAVDTSESSPRDSLDTAGSSTLASTTSHTAPSRSSTLASTSTAASSSSTLRSCPTAALTRPISTLLKKHNKERSTSEKGDKDEVYDVSGPQPSCQLFSVFKALAAGNAGINEDETETEAEDDNKSEAAKESPLGADTTKRPSFSYEDVAARRASIEAADADAAAAAHQADESAAAAATAASGTVSESEAVKRWLRDTVSNNEAMGQRFAAVSVSHLSPLTARDRETVEIGAEDSKTQGESDDEFYPADDSVCATPDTHEARDTKITSHYTRDEALARFRRDHISAEEKLKVIQEEFGDIASKMVNADGVSDPERMLAESQGSLFKSIMMVGNLHLTTHRLVFHALLPPDNMYDQKDSGASQSDAASGTKDGVIISGSVVVHRDNPLKPRKRVWMELSPDMLTTYPSSTDSSRVRPLYSILLSNALKLAPFDETQPLDFYLSYHADGHTRTIHFTVDNDTSAIRWRRHFEDVLFRHARNRFRKAHCRDAVAASGGDLTEEACKTAGDSEWALLRCCVPLDRATIKGLGDYHSFATLVNLEVAIENKEHVTWLAENLPSGSLDVKSPTPPKHTRTSSSGSNTPSIHSGSSTPTRSRSLRQALPSFKKHPRSREASRDRSPLAINTTTASDLSDDGKIPSPTYLHTTIPPRFARLQPHLKKLAPEDHEDSDVVEFLMAVLNEQSWFAEALSKAVDYAHERHYKEGEVPAKMVLDVAGYDCLAGDDEHDADSSSLDSDHIDDDDDEYGKPRMVVEARKAEKAAMASRVFGLRLDEGVWLKRCYVQHTPIPARGHIIVNPRYICFWRRARVGSDIKYRFATHDVKGAENAPPIRKGLHGFVLKVQGQKDLKFELFNEGGRDEVVKRINDLCASTAEPTAQTLTAPPAPTRTETGSTTASEMSSVPSTVATTPSQQTADERWIAAIRDMDAAPPNLQINPALIKAGGEETLKQAAQILAPPPDMLLYPHSMSEQALSYMPFMANRPWGARGWNVRLTPRTFTMLTIGSRGDVQPYIALGLRLMQDGHKVVIVTHDEFKKWIEGYGIEHRQAGGDPTALMKLSTEHRMFSPGFFKEALGGFRAWLDALLVDAWEACQDADVLIESPSAMAGVHIAEALKIPYFRAFTMPWTRTAAYPQAFMVPAFEMGPSFNYSTYVLFDSIMWRASSGQINRWRKKTLGLGATDQSSLSISKVPFLYNFSPAVVPKPLDWYDDITITGYWNLENSDMDWSPPESLVKFMDKAKAEHRPIVYIGFGSIVVPDPAAVTRAIIEGVEKSGVRAIIAKGWSARDSKESEDDIAFPESCYPLDKVPHGWLFPKIQAAMHHGGAGTTGASLRSGIPTLIKPWFGDQHFWALRVTKLGAGMKVASLRADDIAEALRKATTNTVMIEKAARIGERIRQESGVDTAVQAIHFNLVRAATDRVTLKKEDNKKRTETSSFPALSTLPSLPGITVPVTCRSSA